MPLGAQWDTLGGDFRFFQFVAVGDDDEQTTVERGALRLKLEPDLSPSWQLEIHALLGLASPPAADRGFERADRDQRRFFDLTAELSSSPSTTIPAEIDRLDVRWQGHRVRVVAGRQPITWGVNYFWPVLDLFGPFAPQQIDRDYKPGVDALRMTVALDDFSEVEVVAAALGDDLGDDMSYGSLARLHSGAVDWGLMAGRFHTDTVVGGFATADVYGNGLRGEVAYTDPGDGDPRHPALAALDLGSSFWRATVGFDRLLTPRVTLTAESSYNGFGTDEPELYPLVAARDRVARGEITSLGRLYSAVSVGWQAGPLAAASAALLHNWQDGSFLLQPSAEWSVGNASALLAGIIAGFGRDRAEGPAGEPRSEYGAVPLTLWAAVKVYF